MRQVLLKRYCPLKRLLCPAPAPSPHSFHPGAATACRYFQILTNLETQLPQLTFCRHLAKNTEALVSEFTERDNVDGDHYNLPSKVTYIISLRSGLWIGLFIPSRIKENKNLKGSPKKWKLCRPGGLEPGEGYVMCGWTRYCFYLTAFSKKWIQTTYHPTLCCDTI